MHGSCFRLEVAVSVFLCCFCVWCSREATRDLYAPFESNMRYSSSDVYQHEMPGGQYTNLKFQAASLGLGDSWGKVQKSYAAANRCAWGVLESNNCCLYHYVLLHMGLSGNVCSCQHVDRKSGQHLQQPVFIHQNNNSNTQVASQLHTVSPLPMSSSSSCLVASGLWL